VFIPSRTEKYKPYNKSEIFEILSMGVSQYSEISFANGEKIGQTPDVLNRIRN
jgi:hypothetical protein